MKTGNINDYLSFYQNPDWYLMDENGVVLRSSDEEAVGTDTSSDPVLSEFLEKLSEAEKNTLYIRPLSAEDVQSDSWYKWMGCAFGDGNYAVIRFTPGQYYFLMDAYIQRICRFEAVGTGGFSLIVKYNGRVISAPLNLKDTETSIPTSINMKKLLSLSDAETVFLYDLNGERYYTMYTQCDGYYAISLLPQREVIQSWKIFVLIIALLIILLLLIIFLRVNHLTNRLIVGNITKINTALSEITAGNLDREIEVRDNLEFRQLSEGINSTVSALKGYIARESERLNEELSLAHSIQTSSLPDVFPPYPDRHDIDVFALMTPAKEVGGDFYDFFFTDSTHFVFLVADVSDKGIPAAMFMMKAKTIIKSLAQANRSVEEVITVANNALCEDNSADMFVTLWCGVLDTETGKVSYVNAGHCKPLVRHADGGFTFLDAAPDFVVAGEENFYYHRRELTLTKGDALFLYTDGVTEAADIHDTLYGNGRLQNVLNAKPAAAAKELCESVRADVAEFARGANPTDDITMLSVFFFGEHCSEEITVKAANDNISEVYDFLEEHLNASRFEQKVIEQMGIIADEICANIIRYAYPSGKEGDLTVRYTFDSVRDEAEITFTDCGVPFNPLKAPDPDITDVENRPEGGMGIFLIKKFSDKVLYVYSDDKNILTVIKKRTSSQNGGGEAQTE